MSIAFSIGLMVWPSPASFAVQSAAPGEGPAESFRAFLADAPQDVKSITPILTHAAEVFESSQEIQQRVKQVRIEQDAVKTKLTAANGELEVTSQQRQQLEQQLHASEVEQQARFESLRKRLESRLEEELTVARGHIAGEQEEDFARRVQVFEAHQRESIGNALEQDFQLKARELQQLTQEIEAQTQEFAGRLARLEASPDVANALQRSASETLVNRKAALESRRAKLASEGDALLAKQRGEFIAQLKSQQVVDLQRRLILKEASLRQAMAELLHKTTVDESGMNTKLRQAIADVVQHYGRLAQQQTTLKDRVEALSQALSSDVRRLGELETDQHASLARLEEAFQKPNPGLHPEALAWFGRTIQSLPPELATELGAIHQRLLARADQERQLAEQRRMLRERQIAMQLSQQIESEFHQAELKQQREQAARARKADELLGKAEQLAGQSRYDDALQLIAQAQALPSPQLTRVAVLREQIIAAKDEATRQAQTVQIEQSFARAMEVFKQGRYEDAIGLFEKVIAQESQGQGGESSVQLANQKSP